MGMLYYNAWLYLIGKGKSFMYMTDIRLVFFNRKPPVENGFLNKQGRRRTWRKLTVRNETHISV